MAAEPTTPIRVPKAASTYTPSTQDPDLRHQINTILLKDGHISKIQETLLHTLNTSPTNWPTLIQTHALTLLRSGEITTFPQLMSRVLEDIKNDVKVEDGNNAGLGVPKGVVEEGLRITRECLDGVVEVGE
ncbi:hypothetical protein LOCC1_G006382 [Lachnellula occidentalis]|uniref:Uncharacterized protein n=1 Tax=Lachnellula occidentalis TaxID=215460 RepID=A0A8H8UAP8_9HELO|nr:hypothetical protein LOCC1_G006382 [Lachnellula occidentalis]